MHIYSAASPTMFSEICSHVDMATICASVLCLKGKGSQRGRDLQLRLAAQPDQGRVALHT